jgi:probable HAF family extracellular repeat protein
MIDLGTLGGANSSAFDINDSGQVVGSSDTSSGQSHAFFYSGEKMIDLGTLGGGHRAAYGIDNSGPIVGCSKEYAFLFMPAEREFWAGISRFNSGRGGA